VVLETSAVIASPKPCLEEGRRRDEPNNRQIRRVNCLPDQPEFLACRDRAGDDHMTDPSRTQVRPDRCEVIRPESQDPVVGCTRDERRSKLVKIDTDDCPRGRQDLAEVMVDDLMAVLDEVGSERTALFGYEESNFIVCMAAATRPDRVSHAILLNPDPTWIRDDEITWEWSHREWDAQIDRMRRLWGTRGLASELAPTGFPSIVGNDQELQWLARFERLTQSPGAAVAELRKHSETDVRGVLPSIHVPSLVLHRPDDAFIDARSPHYVADRIPDARFVQIPGRDHAPWGEEPDALWRKLRSS
jgi:pimeloyl-ACP methyl ester carboxylesterase